MARATRPMVWPREEETTLPPEPPPPPAIAGWIDAASFVGRFGPEFSRALGARLSLRRAAGTTTDAPLIALGEAESAGRRFAIALDRATIATLLERMFGAETPSPHDHLAALSPASASWKALAHLVGDALTTALAEAGAPAARFTPAHRIEPAPPAPTGGRLTFALDLAGAPGLLALAGTEAIPAASADASPPPAGAASPLPPAGHQPRSATGPAWRARAAALARTLDVTVGARIAEFPLPLATLAALKVGDILPIERPRLLMLTVDGLPYRPLGLPEANP